MKEPKFILCTEWNEIAKELRRQLKPHGLTVKFKTYRGHDQITAHVSKIETNSLKGKHLYWCNVNPKDPNLCPLCDSPLKGCHIGEYCGNKGCPYVDGVAWLTKQQVKKYGDKIKCSYASAVVTAANTLKNEDRKTI